MSKRHILVDTASPCMPKQPKTPTATNWGLCALCQTDTNEPLQCPARTTKPPIGRGYVTLAENLLQFQELGHMPMHLDLGRLDSGGGLEATLVANSAKWHKTCRLKFNQTKLERMKQKTLLDTQSGAGTSTIHTRSSASLPSSDKSLCFFCNQPAGSTVLHEASTYQLDQNVRECALQLKDTELLAKLAPGDMIALEAKYHLNCLAMLYKRAQQAMPKEEDADEARLHGIAFAELVAFMEDMRDEDCSPVFKLADLGNLYRARLEQLGATVDHRVHTTRLKIRLLAVFPQLREHTEGRDKLLSFEKDIGPALRKACDHDNDAMHLVRAAQVVRREMFNTKFNFDGSFQPECQREAVPTSLLALVNMILDGANIKHQTQLVDAATSASALTVSQLLVFNSVKHSRQAKSPSTVRHNRDRETPLPLYVALKVHGATRSRGLVDTLYHLGICVSYDRLLQVSSDVANGLCQRFRMEDVVCPPKMRTGLFTTAAVDNIDHNPSSTTAKDSFHGTGISLMQHPSPNFAGFDRGVLVLDQSTSGTRSISSLPTTYASVPPAVLKTKQFTAPRVQSPVRPQTAEAVDAASADEFRWLEAVMAALEKKKLDKADWVSWSAYHADIQQAVIPPAAIVALLPLFLENAHSVAMIRHSMDVVKAAVQHLNPGQVPVLAADQPLYALAKEIQWTWPATHGEDHFVIMFGGLHIEMAVLQVTMDYLCLFRRHCHVTYKLQMKSTLACLFAAPGRLAQGQWVDTLPGASKHCCFWNC